jgi:hypothetical protein
MKIPKMVFGFALQIWDEFMPQSAERSPLDTFAAERGGSNKNGGSHVVGVA